MVDLLEQQGISWATYQENMPTDGFGGFRYIFSVVRVRQKLTLHAVSVLWTI